MRPPLPLAVLGLCVLLGGLALPACHRAPKDSPQYQEAFTLYNALYARALDDAYGDPQMPHVAELLAAVDPASAPAPEARELLGRVQQGMTDFQARRVRQADAVKAASQPARFDGSGSATVDARPIRMPVNAVAGPALGLSRDEFTAHYGDCFERKGDYEQGDKRGEAFGVVPGCAQRYPAFADAIVVLVDNKVSALVPTKEVTVRTVDAGALTAESTPAPPPPPPPPPAPEQLRFLPGAPHPEGDVHPTPAPAP